MIPSFLIVGASVLLFGYWFRYTCLLILSAKTAMDYTNEVAEANQLHFRSVQASLREGTVESFAKLEASLSRDYALLTYLLKHAASSEVGDDTIEQHMLKADYQVMRVWLRVSRVFWPAQARQAIEEMALV